MKFYWAKFRTVDSFLPGYLAAQILIVLAAIIALINIRGLNFHLQFNSAYLLIVPFAVVFGISIPSLMHNCVHGNLKSKTLNYIIGELTCLFVLMGMAIISINHTLHHAHADSDMDPHSPEGKSFLEFFFTSLLSGVGIIGEKYYQFHGRNTKTVFFFNASVVMHFTGIVLKLALWFLVLGPELFIVFFIPAFFAYVFVFSHVNYVTHAEDENGEIQILNINSNIYYNFINFIGSGIYFHKNHHRRPGIFNPQHLRKRELS